MLQLLHATATAEDQLYTITNRTDKPADLQNNTAYDARYGQKMSRLSALAGEQKVGPSIILKVMSGDVVHAKTDYYYKDNGKQQNRTSLLGDLAGNLISMLTGGAAGGAAKVQASAIGANAQLDNVVQSLITNQNNTYNSQRPKAYLNYIVFDEQFQAKTQGTIQVQNSGPLQAALPIINIPIDQNGWIYVFVNNESEQPVYFDNFQVTQRSNVLEEDHYYPFGLTMKAISPRAMSIKPVNKDKYNGKELQSEEFADGTGSEMYDYGARMYDPQIGRWQQMDPLASVYSNVSAYNYALNNPVNFIDPDGRSVDGPASVDPPIVKIPLEFKRNFWSMVFDEEMAKYGTPQWSRAKVYEAAGQMQDEILAISLRDYKAFMTPPSNSYIPMEETGVSGNFTIKDAEAGLRAIYDKFGKEMQKQ